jgi:acyl-CoA thioesterase YciA
MSNEKPGRPNNEPSIRTVAMPADTNPNGDIFGGWLMSQMDVAGGVFANYIANGRVTTVAVEGMTFHLPVQVGDEVSCYCSTQRIGNTSLAIHVQTWVRRHETPTEEKVTEAIFTYVAIDREGRPRPVRQG